MKKFILLFICTSAMSFANAQIAKWLIEPSYDSIQMANGINAVITDSANIKTLWTYDGKRIIVTPNVISEFRENRMVSTVPGSSRIASIFNEKGEQFVIENGYVAYNFPYFSCGKLLVQIDNFYRFVSADGKVDESSYTIAYPYFNGYASCQAYKNPEKQKDARNILLNRRGGHVQFSFDGKTFDDDDIEFVSSVNDENIAIVVIKHKIYMFNGKDGSLSPVFAMEGEPNTKNQAKLDNDFEKCLTFTRKKTTVLTAKCGKNHIISFEFDEMQKPVSLIVDGTEKKYNVKTEVKKEIYSPLNAYSIDNLYCIKWDDIIMLPPQFDNVIKCIDNKALVCLNGKYGMLEIDKNANFTLKINKGTAFAFLHKTFATKVRVDMPSYILSDKTYLDFIPNHGILLDKTSRERKNTESGNFVMYDCELTIPNNLSSDPEIIKYPVQVLYNGLKSPVIEATVNAWFYKRYVVEIDENQKSVDNGTLTFVFNIKETKDDGTIVKFDVSVTADTLLVQIEDTLSETRYKCKVYNLNEGVNNIVVQVHEQGCPPTSFPFVIEYHKPVAKTKKTPAQEESVIIKKKEKKKDSNPEQSTLNFGV